MKKTEAGPNEAGPEAKAAEAAAPAKSPTTRGDGPVAEHATAEASIPAGLRQLETLMNGWLTLHRRPPSTLYHYTNAQGLYGMLATGRVWATNVAFLNDP